MWANRAELDLAKVFGADLPFYGSRCKTVETFWRPLLQVSPPSKDPSVRGLKWLEVQLKALKLELNLEVSRPYSIIQSLIAPPLCAATAKEGHPKVFQRAASLASGSSTAQNRDALLADLDLLLSDVVPILDGAHKDHLNASRTY